MVTVPSQPQTPIKPPASVRFGVRAGRFWEIWYPWVFGLLAGTGVYIWNQPPDAVYGALNKSLSSALDAAAVLAGFQSTALSLLLTLVNSPPIKKLRRLSLFRPLVWYHAHAIGALLICIVVFVLLLAVMGVHTTLGDWSRLVGAFVSMLVVAAMLAACRVTWLMVRVLVKHGDQMSDAE